MFKHKTDTVHYHDTVAEARACEDSLFALCAHGMARENCFGPQHYMYDSDEQAVGLVNEGPVFPYAGKAMTDQQMWEAGMPVSTHFQGSLRTGDGMYYKAGHDDPCVCDVYNRCNPQRAADAQWSGNWRDQFRAYND